MPITSIVGLDTAKNVFLIGRKAFFGLDWRETQLRNLG